MRLWSVLTVCVVLDNRTKAKDVTAISPAVVTVKEPPGLTFVALRLDMVGRVARSPVSVNKYGGEKI